MTNRTRPSTKKNSNKQNPLSTILGTIVLLWMIGTIVSVSRRSPSPSAIQTYTVLDPSHKLQNIWIVENVYEGTTSGGGLIMAISGEEVLFLGSKDDRRNTAGVLLKLDLATGQIRSHISVSEKSERIASNNNFVFIGVGSGQKIDSGTLNGAAQVVAYNASSGEQVWSQRVRGARGINDISIYSSGISVIGSTVAGERYQYLNAENGQIQYSDDANRPVFYTGDTWYIMQPPSRLRAVTNSNNTPLWERRFDTEVFNYSSVHFAPVLDNGIIVGRTGEGVGRVYALDSATGQLLWRSEDVVYGNVVASRGVTFYLTEQAELKAVNSRTGQVLATVIFEPESPQEKLTYGGRLYNVATNGEIVVVYLGDSRQLFAFRFIR